VIEHYIGLELRKDAARTLPPSDLDWTDPNALDDWLRHNGHKFGVLSAFKAWSIVTFDLANLLECGVVASLAQELAVTAKRYQRLGLLQQAKAFATVGPWHEGLAIEHAESR
jgi:hypothetical protein